MTETHFNSSKQEAIAMMQTVMPAGAAPGAYHRLITLSMLLPEDDMARSAIMRDLTFGSEVLGMKVVDIQQGHAVLELDAAKQYIVNPDNFAEACQALAMSHNATLLHAMRKQAGAVAKPAVVALLTPWRDMANLLTKPLFVAAILALIGLLALNA